MSIEAVAVPPKSRLWNDQDAKQAYDLLTGGPVNEEGKQVDAEGNVLADDAQRKPQAAKFGTYPLTDKDGKPLADNASDEAKKQARARAESKARTQGMSLDRVILANHGRRFGVSVWVDQDGNTVGALVPREPIQRKAAEGNGKPAAAAETPKRGRGSRSK